MAYLMKALIFSSFVIDEKIKISGLTQLAHRFTVTCVNRSQRVAVRQSGLGVSPSRGTAVSEAVASPRASPEGRFPR